LVSILARNFELPILPESTFWIGDYEVLGQSFGGVVDEKNVFDNAIYDGLVGLAYAG